MACIRKRRGKWVVDYRDGAQRRRWKTCRTYREAEDFLAKIIPESRSRLIPMVDPTMPFGAYVSLWEEVVRPTIKPRTFASYRQMLRLHILPHFEKLKFPQIHRGYIKTFLAAKLSTGLAPNTVRIMLATLRVICRAAMEDGILPSNPAEKLGRQLHLIPSKLARQERIKAMTATQRVTFLMAAAKYEPRWYPLFFTMAGTGMRLGEVLALQWQDVDWLTNEIRVMRGLSAGQLSTPKSGYGRTVDISTSLGNTLNRLLIIRKEESLRWGWGELPRWMFVNKAGKLLDDRSVRKAMTRILQQAPLPTHFSPHCLRHTYASLMLQQGESPAYVQRQLGHASIQLTVDTYGKWLPMGNKAAVNRLDEFVDLVGGSNLVAQAPSPTEESLQPVDLIGGPYRDRTCGPLIKSQLLYQLS